MKNPQNRAFTSRIATIFDRLWPSVCTICAHSGYKQLDLCPSCQSQLPYLNVDSAPGSIANRFMTLCLACGQPLPAGYSCCQYCVNKSSRYAQLVVPFRYAFPVDKMIGRLKYGGKLELGRLLGELLAEEVLRQAVDRPCALIPMPMHPDRYRKRGYNQSEEIARWCGHRLGLPMQGQWVQRLADTPPLAGLGRGARELEIRGAFIADNAVRDQHVAIIDDVLTTGASSAELARELYDTGAKQVSLWAVARTAMSAHNQADLVNHEIENEVANAEETN